MTVNVRITGQTGINSDAREVHVHPFNTANGIHTGVVALTHPFLELEPSTKFFLNSSFGNAMNQSIVFIGGSEIITTGSDGIAGWVASANQGSWVFNSGLGVTGSADSITLAANNDQASYLDAGSTDMSGHTAITGQIKLIAYDPNLNNLNMQFQISGLIVGNSINLEDFIDTGILDSYQGFVIPKSTLGLEDQFINEMLITLERTGGARPTIALDDFQVEVSGDPAIFELVVDRGGKFHIQELIFAYADALDAQANADASMPDLSYNKILALTELANGFTITRKKKGKTLFSATIKSLGAHISAGALPTTTWSDGTNTFVILKAIFDKPLILTGDTDDTLTVQINDDMSGLLQFTAAGRGSLEVR